MNLYNEIGKDDLFGNIPYPKSVYNSVIGYDGDETLSSILFVSVIVVSLLDFFHKKKVEENNKSKTENYIDFTFKYFFICLFTLISNLVITLCVIPIAKPEIASFEFPMAYTGQFGNALYYKFPMLHIVFSVFFRSFIYSMTASLPLLLDSAKNKALGCINLLLIVLNVSYIIISLKLDEVMYFPFLIPSNNFFYYLNYLVVYSLLLSLCNLAYIFKYKTEIYNICKNKISYINILFKNNIALILLAFVLILLRIISLNNSFVNQKVCKLSGNNEFEINNTTIAVESVKLMSEEQIYQKYDIDLDNNGKVNKILLANFSLKNNKSDKVYFDFSDCYLMIGQWFTNLDLELFNIINTSMNGNIRVCLREGSTVDLVVPFLLSYDDSNMNDSLYHSLFDAKRISLYIGKYPIKYQYDIDNSYYNNKKIN